MVFIMNNMNYATINLASLPIQSSLGLHLCDCNMILWQSASDPVSLADDTHNDAILFLL